MRRQLHFDFRPSTYWPTRPGTRTALVKIKGTARRAAALRSLVEGSSSPPKELLAPSLEDDVRAQLGALHPALMGGEYLPELESDEVEIARLDLASTTADVIALVAGRAGSKIRYRVVDEYETNYVCAPESSDLPLTLRELVALLDHAHAADAFAAQVAYGLIEGFWEQHLLWGDTPEHAVSFAAVSSAFYPALAECYEGRAEEWIGNSRENPLPPEALASLETAWQQATTEQRRVVVEFLKSHGYVRGSFRMYGARHLQLMLTLLAHQPLASRTVQVPADGGTPR